MSCQKKEVIWSGNAITNLGDSLKIFGRLVGFCEMAFFDMAWRKKQLFSNKNQSKTLLISCAFFLMMNQDISFPNLNISEILRISPHFSPPFSTDPPAGTGH